MGHSTHAMRKMRIVERLQREGFKKSDIIAAICAVDKGEYDYYTIYNLIKPESAEPKKPLPKKRAMTVAERQAKRRRKM